MSRIGFSLTTENNSWCGSGYHDGEVLDVFTELGENNAILLKPKKHIYLEETCRETPFNAFLYKEISKTIRQCDVPCRIPNYWLCKYMAAVEDLPICKTRAEKQCYVNVLNEARKNIPLKPCTSLEYERTNTLWPHPNKNEAMIEIKFESPPVVKVKEEFLIFDMVAMISAIGGTMGLCVGFSFREIFGCLCQWIELALRIFKDKNNIAPERSEEKQKTLTKRDGNFVNREH